jgi:hypothetical protein
MKLSLRRLTCLICMFVAKHVIYLDTQIYPSLGRYLNYRDYPDGYPDTSWQMST